MSAPSVPDYVNIHVRINVQQFLKKFGYDEAVFPVIKGIMPFFRMDIAGHKQIAYSFYFLPIRYMIISPKNILLPSINFDCSLSLFIKGKKDGVLRKKRNNLLYCKFFL